jgi:hypothetical protein
MIAQDGAGRLYGPDAAVGRGRARAYIVFEQGRPIELGIEMTEASLLDLPAHGDHLANETVLEVPPGSHTPFRHLTVNWNPAGHGPTGIYTLPHFDFHFYTIEDAARRAIHPADSAFRRKAAALPTPEYVPAGYVSPAPFAVPLMGVHWVDPTSPEFKGGTFTTTFQYGSYDGQMIFIEPMITKAYLETKQSASFPVPVAAKHVVAGYYPSSYTVRFNQSTSRYDIALTNLRYRN